MQIPKWMRLFLAWILIGIGFPLFITPMPGGFLLLKADGMLLFCALPSLRNRLRQSVERHPNLSRRLAPLFSSCHICPNECRSHPATSDISPVFIQSVSIRTDRSREEKLWGHDKIGHR